MDVYIRRSLFLLFLLTFSKASFADCSFIDQSKKSQMICNYERYYVQVSCKYRLPIISAVTLRQDRGNQNTSSRNYYLDEQAKELNCQQTSSKRYSQVDSDFDVGHMTAIDHLDDSITAALETNAMTNLVPQNKTMNRQGAWKRTESLVECYRDGEGEDFQLEVLSGVIIGSDISNDHFTVSHNLLRTPDYLWKLVYFQKSNQYDAWIIKNSASSTADQLSKMRALLSKIINELESDNKIEQAYAIQKLSDISQRKPTMTELKFNKHCNKRIG